MADNQSQAVATKSDEKAMEFIPYGANDKIKLTIGIIQKVIAKRTKSGQTCSEKDAINFLMMCSGKRLNPFEGDCYLVGYDNQTTGVAEFSQITAETAFLKRAELHPEYDGLESGLILQNEADGSIQEVEGEFYLKGQECLGAWARVHLKTRKIPTYDRLLMHKYRKKTPFWDNNPEHQIVKCARVAVLRRSFPTMLGGLYLAEEMALPMTSVTAHEINPSRLVDVKSADSPKPEPPAQDTTVVGQEPAQNQSTTKTDNELLAQVVTGEGFTFDEFKRWANETGNIENADLLKGFHEVQNKVAARLLRAKTGLLKGLADIKNSQSV